ncbi:hypothetical protein J6P11_03110, partial [bacterium]|nr:hypothetical protein [bacterium]
MFSSKRNNKVLIFATIVGLVFFLIVYSSYIYTDIIPSKLVQGKYVVNNQTITELHNKPVASYDGYKHFDNLIESSCGIYIVYNIVIP